MRWFVELTSGNLYALYNFAGITRNMHVVSKPVILNAKRCIQPYKATIPYFFLNRHRRMRLCRCCFLCLQVDFGIIVYVLELASYLLYMSRSRL